MSAPNQPPTPASTDVKDPSKSSTPVRLQAQPPSPPNVESNPVPKPVVPDLPIADMRAFLAKYNLSVQRARVVLDMIESEDRAGGPHAPPCAMPHDVPPPAPQGFPKVTPQSADGWLRRVDRKCDKPWHFFKNGAVRSWCGAIPRPLGSPVQRPPPEEAHLSCHNCLKKVRDSMTLYDVPEEPLLGQTWGAGPASDPAAPPVPSDGGGGGGDDDGDGDTVGDSVDSDAERSDSPGRAEREAGDYDRAKYNKTEREDSDTDSDRVDL